VETIAQTLQRQLQTRPNQPLSLGELLVALGPRGPAALMVVLPVPFILPVQIPGLSVPFGLVLVLIGAQLGWRDQLWCPQWLADREIQAAYVEKIIPWVERIEGYLARWFSPRLSLLTESHWAHKIIGIVVIALASVLSIPLPIPFSNMFVSVPLIILGLSLLSRDGLACLIGLVLSAAGLGGVIGLAVFALREIQAVAAQ
jgi:hypothetical protein